ncbi:sigma-70 family RNA polymerase sigma factor [Radiobacillus sp. PE A8.2]|uniref:sigma-70 family RNA polymerase sigma factor n=1 Tax=Radiobacillus sp. PE A8.2 TaxID=3380349 RepID=UPI00388D17BC
MSEFGKIPETNLFESILQKYGEDVKRLIFLYVKNITVTDDLWQEVFIKIYNNLERYENKSSIKTWIYQIAINQCRDYFRSWHRTKVVLGDFVDRQSTSSVEEIVVKGDESIFIAKKVLSLSIKYREVIILFYYKELKVKEVSSILNLNESTVKTRISRGRDLLRKKLGGVDLE